MVSDTNHESIGCVPAMCASVRGRAHHFVIDVIVRFGRSCLANLRGVRDPAAQLAFELEDAKSDYGLGVAPAHNIGQIKRT